MSSAFLHEASTGIQTSSDKDELHSEKAPTSKVHWGWLLYHIVIHARGAYAVYLLFSGHTPMRQTFLWSLLILALSGAGTTLGAHRLWSHKSYKAKLPLRIILVIGQTFSNQFGVIHWSRLHRMHHKYTETHADPHNAKRGFMFSHIQWIFQHPNSVYQRMSRNVDTSDLEADPLLRFQQKFYIPLIILAYAFSGTIPWLLWNEDYTISSVIAADLRLLIIYHATFLVNSAAHLWGTKPYEKGIYASENKFVAFLSLGEGWHNYHHVFPWDYKTSEFGLFNPSKRLIDFFARVGWAYDLKTVPEEIVKKRIARTGDGSHKLKFEGGPWGWGDSTIAKNDLEITEILYPVEN